MLLSSTNLIIRQHSHHPFTYLWAHCGLHGFLQSKGSLGLRGTYFSFQLWPDSQLIARRRPPPSNPPNSRGTSRRSSHLRASSTSLSSPSIFLRRSRACYRRLPPPVRPSSIEQIDLCLVTRG